MAIRKNNRHDLRVYLWGKEIGTLTWNPDREYAYFFKQHMLPMLKTD